MNVAEMAFDAFFWMNIQLENIPARDEAEESSQRTDIAAPESFSGKVKQEDADEKHSQEKSLAEYGIDR